ncbi:MAG: hypothetical protein AB7I30_01910 [Isosphaeraceae bacterium]
MTRKPPDPNSRTLDSGTAGGDFRRDRISVRELMVLIAGVAVGVWIVLPDLKDASADPVTGVGLLGVIGVLGGLSFVGVPLLLWERFRSNAERTTGPWGPGRLTWFATGTSAWLLWPPIVAARIQGEPFGRSPGGICFLYGTPLMAVYVTAALLTGGWLRRRRRRRRGRSWRERFGLLLGLAWACTGLYFVFTFYHDAWERWK